MVWRLQVEVSSLYRSCMLFAVLTGLAPAALPKTCHEGVDPAPELPLPVPSAWETVPVKVPSPWNVNSFANRRGLGGDFRTFPSYPAAWESVEMGWLRRTVGIPA